MWAIVIVLCPSSSRVQYRFILEFIPSRSVFPPFVFVSLLQSS
jgi:hypothetical protein